MSLFKWSSRKEAAVKDPVCGMAVDPARARWTSSREGQTYYFCAPGCKQAFEADPAHFLAAEDRHDTTTHG